MTEQITLYGEEADWFREVEEDIARRCNGAKPSNAEVVRKLTEESTYG